MKQGKKIRVLVIGSGGREHALAWKIAQSPAVEKVFIAPGNAGTATVGENVAIGAEEFEKIADFAKREKIGLVFVGPDNPLVEGIVDFLMEKGLNVFGPAKNAAIIEGSKLFTRNLLKKYGIPSAEYASFDDAKKAKAYLRKKGAPIVVKADGLALGKGVVVAETVEEAEKAIDEMLVGKKFGKAGNRILLEEKLLGEEASFFAFSDGKNIKAMASSQDHKRVFDNDLGPNCYSADTEILTIEGWKTFDRLNKNEKVATFDSKTRAIIFENPKEIYWMKHKGKMIHFKHRLLDLLVTPNHRMLVEKRKSKRIHICEAEKLAGENDVFLSGNWNGKDKKCFVLPEFDYKFNRKLKRLRIPFIEWVRFLGIYLSEGYVSSGKSEHRVYICQTRKSKHFRNMQAVLSKLPFDFTYSDKESKFRINSIQLANVLKEFGTSHYKFVPDYVKAGKKETILEFLKYFNMGDGDIHRGSMRFCTGSSVLAGNLQELVLKCGFASIITKDKRNTMTNPINKKKYEANPVYSLEITKRNKAGVRKKNIARVDYNGFVGCVEVSTGFVVVRRNNRVAISGNTGGMGAYSPAPVVTKPVEKRVMKEIMQPAIDAMRKEGREFKGVLYAGLMISREGPRVVEFNCRLGDPETQALLPRLDSDLVPIVQSCIDGNLAKQKIKWNPKACCCVVMASGGYPEHYEKGKEIFGLGEAAKLKETVVFHAGTKKEKGKVLSSGGRVLGVTALGKTIRESIGNAYKAVQKISFEGMHCRKDIGQKALEKSGLKET